MEYVVEVVGRSSSVQLRPLEVHRLLPVEAVARTEGEQFDEASRLPQAPGVLPHGPVPYRDPEPAEQPNAHGLGVPTHGVLPPSTPVTNLAYLGARLKNRPNELSSCS